MLVEKWLGHVAKGHRLGGAGLGGELFANPAALVDRVNLATTKDALLARPLQSFSETDILA